MANATGLKGDGVKRCHHAARIAIGLDPQSAIPVCLACRRDEREQIARMFALGKAASDEASFKLSVLGEMQDRKAGMR